jgi:hypothetical protein
MYRRAVEAVLRIGRVLPAEEVFSCVAKESDLAGRYAAAQKLSNSVAWVK